MLTVYQPPKEKEAEDDDRGQKLVLPAGRPYLTKVNGKLVMAREKRDKPIDTAMDILGEAFGLSTTRVIRRRSKSADGKANTPRFLAFPGQHQQIAYPASYAPSYGSPYLPFHTPPPTPSLAYFPNVMQVAQYQPQFQQQFQQQFQPQQIPPRPPALPPPVPHYPAPSSQLSEPRRATKEDLELLKRVDADYNSYEANQKQLQRSSSAPEIDMVSKTTITVTKHICANCGRLRSKKYHHENPIKPGEEPLPTFCRKCQKDASSTSSGHSGKNEKSKKKKEKSKKDKKKKDTSLSTEEHSASPKPKPAGIEHRTVIIKEVERRPSAEYVIVEEFSDGESRRRGRSTRPRYLEESEIGRRPQSMLSNQRLRSASQFERYEHFDRSVPIPQRYNYYEAGPQPQPRRPYPTSPYDYAPAPPPPPRAPSPSPSPSPPPRQKHNIDRSPSRWVFSDPVQVNNYIKLESHREHRDTYERVPERPSARDQGIYEAHPERHIYRDHEPYEAAPQRQIPRREITVDEPDKMSSRQSKSSHGDHEVKEIPPKRRLPREKQDFEQRVVTTSGGSKESHQDREMHEASLERLSYRDYHTNEIPSQRQISRREDSFEKQEKAASRGSKESNRYRSIHEVSSQSQLPQKDETLEEPDNLTSRQWKGSRRDYEWYETKAPLQRPLPHRNDSFEDRETIASVRSKDSSQRRRRERRRPSSPRPAFRPWEEPHHIHPQNEDEVVVVTERFTYRPKQLSKVQEEHTDREDIDRRKLDARRPTGDFEARTEASNYYQYDWDGDQPQRMPRQEDQRRLPQRDMRRDSRDYASADHLRRAEEYVPPPHDLPRAPSPPPIYNNRPSKTRPPYPLSSDDSTNEMLDNARRRLARLTEENSRAPERSRSISDDSEIERMSKIRRRLVKRGKEKVRGRERTTSSLEEVETEGTGKPRRNLGRDSVEICRERRRSVSNHRPPYVREATDGGTEQALIPSPRHSRLGDPFDEVFSDRVESVRSRRVKFLTPAAAASSSSDEASPVRRDRSPSDHDSDIIEVIVEDSPPRKSKSKKDKKETSGGWEHEDPVAAGDGAWETTAGDQW